jgi:hypothetical protein
LLAILLPSSDLHQFSPFVRKREKKNTSLSLKYLDERRKLTILYVLLITTWKVGIRKEIQKSGIQEEALVFSRKIRHCQIAKNTPTKVHQWVT